MNKQCFKCKETKSTSEFYRHSEMGDGYLGKCKTCTKRDVSERNNRLKNNPAWVAEERKRCRLKQERYRMLGLAKQSSQETKRSWADKNPHKIMAQRKAQLALRRGQIKRVGLCQQCGKSGDIEKHHPDYNYPLLIEWLCTKCHGKTRHKDRVDVIP